MACFFALCFLSTEERGNKFRLSGAGQEQNRILINQFIHSHHSQPMRHSLTN